MPMNGYIYYTITLYSLLHYISLYIYYTTQYTDGNNWLSCLMYSTPVALVDQRRRVLVKSPIRGMGDKKLWKKRRCGRVASVLPGGHIHPKSKGAITNVHVSAVVWEKRTWCQSLLRYDTNGCGHTWDLTLVKGFNRGKKDVQKLYYSKTR